LGGRAGAFARNLFAVIQYLQEQVLEIKARKVAWGAVWQHSIGKCSEHFEGFSGHGICHDILAFPKNKLLI
jgi:hypothetical protein